MRSIALLLLLGECAASVVPVTLSTADVIAVGQTEAVATANADAADDPAIWRNPRDPGASLIVATDKKAGLNVYGIDGRLKSSFPAGRVNNVDLRQVGKRIIVAASDRNDPLNGRIALFELDPNTAILRELGRPQVGVGEAYGLCLYRPARGPLNAFVVFKDGTIRQFDLIGSNATLVRTMKLATQSEGCVADDRTGHVYVGEEDVGIWRFGANRTDPVSPVSVARQDGQRLVADVEGLAIAASGRTGGFLVASSQGDNAYALWRLPGMAYAGRFRIVPGGALGGTSETDGIEISPYSFPGYSGGMMVVQDGDNLPDAQNFKLVRWADVLRALKLKP